MGIVELVESFERCCDACATLAELAPILADAGRELGFDWFALTLCDNLRQSEPRFDHLDNYPAVYAEHFVARRFYRFDPILLRAQRRIGGFVWSAITGLDSDERAAMAVAAGEGLRDGYTVPANVPGEPCGAVSFAARRECALTEERRICADCLARTAFEASRRLRGLTSLKSPVPHLNNREVQCLRRLALGETDKQVARALGISPETVRQYVKMARASYSARTRAQLVALALRDSQIGFDGSAIPAIGGTDPG